MISAEQFERHRPHLQAVAYRMLGSVAAAEPCGRGHREEPRWVADDGGRADLHRHAPRAPCAQRGLCRQLMSRSFTGRSPSARHAIDVRAGPNVTDAGEIRAGGSDARRSLDLSADSVIGQRRVSALSGFLVDLHDAIQHPVGRRFAGLTGMVLDVGDRIIKERALSVAWALWQDDESRMQLCVRAESHEVGVIVRDEHELLADGEGQQLVVSSSELPAVASASRLVAVGVRATDECRGQTLIDPELHAPCVAWRARMGRLAVVSQGRAGRPRRGLACAHNTAT